MMELSPYIDTCVACLRERTGMSEHALNAALLRASEASFAVRMVPRCCTECGDRTLHARLVALRPAA